MKKFIGLTMLFVTLTLTSTAYAQRQSQIHLGWVGQEFDGKQIYVGIVENPSGCIWNGIYFNQSEKGKALTLAVALTAKASEKTVTIDFEQPNGIGTQCFGTGIYVE